jgi:uncharacterized oxidoreductase
MPTLGAPALQAYSTRIFQACKAPADDAATVSDHLVTANLMGFDSHGVICIPEYLGYLREGMMQPGAPTTIVKETATTATVVCGWTYKEEESAKLWKMPTS